jgi:hypothetical protein
MATSKGKTVDKELLQQIWDKYQTAGNDSKLDLFREALMAAIPALREAGQDTQIIYQLLLELEKLKDGVAQGPLITESPINRPPDFPLKLRQRHAALAVELYKLMGHKIEDACDFVGQEIGVDGGTIKNWRYRKPLDYAKTRDDYKSIFSEEIHMIRLYKRLTKNKRGGKARAPSMERMLQLHLQWAKNY